MEKNIKQLKSILEKNPDIVRGDAPLVRWSIKYLKDSDMIILGEKFPSGTFYLHIKDGVMVRIDKKEKIYGFAIENAKSFIKKNPEVGFVFYPNVYPLRFWMHFFWKKSITNIKRATTLSNFVAAQAV